MLDSLADKNLLSVPVVSIVHSVLLSTSVSHLVHPLVDDTLVGVLVSEAVFARYHKLSFLALPAESTASPFKSLAEPLSLIEPFT